MSIRTKKRTRQLALLAVLLLCLTGLASWQLYVASRHSKVTTPPYAKKIADIEYARVDGQPLLLDLYLPQNPEPKRPMVVWIHGGSWRNLSKDDWNPALYLVDNQYAIASINYRLSQQATFPAQIYDCKAAVRWLRAHAGEYGLDGEHIGVWGDSAGGHLAALLGASGGVKALEGSEGNAGISSRVQCVCDWYGPADLVEAITAPMNRQTAGRIVAVTALLGGKNREKAVQASPITYVSKDDPPFLIMHGETDRVVPVEQSRRFAQTLKKAGVPVQLVVIPGVGHMDLAFSNAGNKRTILEFFNRYLK